MRPGARIGAFAATLGVAQTAVALAGAAIDPLREGSDSAHGGHGAPDAERPDPGAHGHAAAGLAVAEDGHLLAVESTTLPRDRAVSLAFRIVAPGGRALTAFDVEHEAPMHLIVVRRDLTGYQHLHPTLDPSGRWSVRVRLPEAGVYRAYADFRAGGRAYTLATDLFVGGPFEPVALPAPGAVDSRDGYRATLATGPVAAGRATHLTYRVDRDGQYLTDIEPYLGADGHLVALREGDLAFLHVHPEHSRDMPGRIAFGASFPSSGRYRLFLQFKHAGEVRTVAHTVEVPR
jgi:hypothetical protein